MKKSTGFSLLELVVVISVIAILAASLIPRISSDALTIAAQAEQVASDIRYTQSLAMTQGQRYRVNFPSTTTYTITDTSGVATFSPGAGNTSAVTLQQSAVITLPPTNLANSLVAFDGRGIPYTDAGATTVLASAATITLTQGSSTRTITIQPQTGRVDVP